MFRLTQPGFPRPVIRRDAVGPGLETLPRDLPESLRRRVLRGRLVIPANADEPTAGWAGAQDDVAGADA